MIELSGCVWLPKSEFDRELEAMLTLQVFKLGSEEPDIVQCFRHDRVGFVGIPRVFGLKLISGRRYEDSRSTGHPVRFKKKIVLRDYQEPFVASMVDAARTRTDFIAQAATGKGKTVCGLALIQMVGRSAAIVVDQENLMDQWVERCIEHLGMKLEDIGIVQGKKATWEGKAITICMMQTLTRKTLPEEFYRAFGVVVFDESHTVGAPTFSRALMMFHAKLRFGLSATPERADALQKALTWNLGTVDVLLTDTPGQSSVYILENETTYSWRVNNSKLTGRFIAEITDDSLRNLDIANAAHWLYNSGRDVLVIGDRVEHLCSLMALCSAVGIPKHDMGLYAKSKTLFVYEKDPRPLRRPAGYERGTEYSPIRLSLVQKTIPKKDLVVVKESARVLFATYGIVAKGVDIPRLSAGIDATPRSRATQVIGRILRVLPGKLRPIWVTFADINSFRSLYQLSQRLDDYETSNAEVFLWDFHKGRKRLDIRNYRRELKSRISLLRQSQIVTSLDGNNTLVIPHTLTGPSD